MVDRGFDFYAPQTFEDETGRRILIGWMGIPDADYTNPTTQAGWQHALTIPRVLHWAGGRLIPVSYTHLPTLNSKITSRVVTSIGRFLREQGYDCLLYTSTKQP